MELNIKSIADPIYHDRPLSFNPQLPERIPGMAGAPATGALLQENGDYLFRIYAPGAREVRVDIMRRSVTLQKGADGFFEGLYPYDPEYCGPHAVDVVIDGTVVLSPHIPICWMRDRPINLIEVPDPETPYINLRDVPHGAITRELYWSEALSSFQRCLVYTPPGYQHSQEAYPVLYLQHGATENETGWTYNGRVGTIMDNLLAEGKCTPFLIVMNDGMARTPEDLLPGAYKFAGFERSLIESCIPFIERTYRVKPGKENRAFAGLSMGSSQALHFGMRHPEVFSVLGMFSAPLISERNRKEIVAQFFDKDYLAAHFKLILRTIGDAETEQYPCFVSDEEKLAAAGVSALPFYHTIVYHNQTHEWGCWRRAFHDFAQMVFR